MRMEYCAKRIEMILEAIENAVLSSPILLPTEFWKCRVIQKKLFQSDFDRFNGDNLLSLDIE